MIRSTSTAPPTPPPRCSRLPAVGAAVAAGVVAYAVFCALPPMHVRVGFRKTDELVSALYQATAFPPLAAFMVERASLSLCRRSMIATLCGAVAAVRLAGWLPLSGHGVLLGAVLACAARSRMTVTSVIAGGALTVTLAHKFGWGDLGWGGVSLAIGGGIGLLGSK